MQSKSRIAKLEKKKAVIVRKYKLDKEEDKEEDKGAQLDGNYEAPSEFDPRGMVKPIAIL